MFSNSIRIGTCSWAARSLIESGAFYPPTVASCEKRLRFYASQFDTVEIDCSYYAIPTPRMTQAWGSRVPEGFLFHVRAYGALTGHLVDPRVLPQELRGLLTSPDLSQDLVHICDPVQLRAMAQAVVAALDPLRSARKLGFAIFQFPPWFTCKNANRDYLLHCKELMQGIPIAVEFRHGSWLTRRHADETLAFLKEHRITYITCDQPQFGDLSTAPFYPGITTSMAYLRVHGRSPELWRDRQAQPAGYSYGEDELLELANCTRSLSGRARTTFVMFNNCRGGHAAANGLRLRSILQHQPTGS